MGGHLFILSGQLMEKGNFVKGQKDEKMDSV